jgi:hypothetical protein
MIVRILLLALGAAAFGWSVRQWRRAVQAALLLLVVEGAIRKWLLPGAQDLVYFAKDALFLGAYLGFFRSRARAFRPHAPLLYGALAFAVGLGVLEMFNPKLPTVLVGVLGFKAYFLYVPLLFVVPAVFPDDVALVRFIRRYTLIIFPVVLLSVAQFFSPAGSMLNTYAQPTDITSITTFGNSSFVRTTGTFSYISGYSSYLLTTTLLLLMLLTATRWSWKGNLIVYAALGTTLLGIMLSGSRGPVFLLAMIFPLYWWLAVAREKQSGKTFLRLIFGLGLLIIALTSAGGQPVTAFSRRASTSVGVVDRLTHPFTSPVYMLPYAGLFGYGIGATHQAASALTGGLGNTWLGTITPEAESGRVMLELGPIGFLAVYLARLGLALFAFGQALRLRTLFHRAVMISALLCFLMQIPGGIVFDVTSGVYYWFLGGLAFLVVRLDRQAVAARPPLPATAARRPAELAPRPAVPALAQPGGWQRNG